MTQIADRQLDDILLDKLNELRGSSYFIAYKPIGHLDYANDLIKKGAFGVTNQPLELFQLVIGAVEEIQSASMKTSGKFERAVSRWAIHRFNATEIKYSVLREQAIPHLLSLRDEIREKNIAISTYYRNNSLINRMPNIIERQQHLLKIRNFDEVVIVLVTPVETIARRLAANIETFTDIPPENSVVIGYLKDDNFEPIAFFPPHSSPIVWLDQEAIP